MNHEKTKTIRAIMHSKHSPERVFPLLCPVEEYKWIEDWKCEIIHTQSGINEKGCVFTTEHRGLQTWVTSDYRPNERVEFVLFGEHRITLYSIRLTDKGGATELVWAKKLIPTDVEGEKEIAEEDSQDFEELVAELEKLLEYYLDHGEMLRSTHP